MLGIYRALREPEKGGGASRVTTSPSVSKGISYLPQPSTGPFAPGSECALAESEINNRAASFRSARPLMLSVALPPTARLHRKAAPNRSRNRRTDHAIAQAEPETNLS